MRAACCLQAECANLNGSILVRSYHWTAATVMIENTWKKPRPRGQRQGNRPLFILFLHRCSGVKSFTCPRTGWRTHDFAGDFSAPSSLHLLPSGFRSPPKHTARLPCKIHLPSGSFHMTHSKEVGKPSSELRKTGIGIAINLGKR